LRRFPRALLAAAIGAASIPSPPSAAQGLGSVDVFGLNPESIVELDRCFGSKVQELVAAASVADPKQAEILKGLERQVLEAGGFEDVAVSMVFGFDPKSPFYLTFNVTPKGGRPPIRYRTAPLGEIADPEGLVASWREYEKLGGFLDVSGEIAEVPSCPAHHCLFGFDHPRLKPFGELFTREVPRRKKELIRLLRSDRDPKKRAAAAYLLAHLPSKAEVVQALLPTLRDPDGDPRNSALRVLDAMADRGEGATIPLAPILPFLRSPVLTDRNKASSLVATFAADPSKRGALLRGAGCALARLLELRQPNQVEFARRALVRLRGVDLTPSSADAWRSWLKTRGVSCRSREPLLEPGSLCPVPTAVKNDP